MKKKIIFFVFLFLTLFFISFEVDATFKPENVEIECAYASGVIIGMSYNSSTGTPYYYVKEYPTAKSMTFDQGDLSNLMLFEGNNKEYSYLQKNFFGNVDNGGYYCKSDVWVSRIQFGFKNEESGEWEYNIRGVYSPNWWYDTNQSTAISSGYYGGTDCKDNATGWWIFGASATQKTCGLTLSSSYDLDNKATSNLDVNVPLVAERLYITGNLPNSDYSVMYKSEPTEAVGSSSYVQFYKSGGVVYAKKGNTMTRITENTNLIGQEYLCFIESVRQEDSSRGDSTYKFNSPYHQIKRISQSSTNGVVTSRTCTNGVLYKLTDEVCKTKVEGKQKISFCDKYGNTAVELIKIIQILQILVPALVIVLTGIDIGKIVIAGNVEEELPKKKKLIIIRGIIMIVFFFLPVIVNLVINLLEDKIIYDVSCLFNNGVQVIPEEEECVTLDE